jgi:Flp pilus assembly pilin Flp
MAHPPSRERGAATVEYAGLVLLVAALIATLIAAVASSPPTTAAHELGSTLARRLRCAPALPGPCWRDPLTLAYGRPLAGAVRALAPSPHTAAAADGSPLLPVDFRYCRSESCAVPKPGPEGRHLTGSGRRTTAFTVVEDERRSSGIVRISYWLYRPGLGWEPVRREAGRGELAAASRVRVLKSTDPVLVPLETLPGRDQYRFPAGEVPPWQWKVDGIYAG